LACLQPLIALQPQGSGPYVVLGCGVFSCMLAHGEQSREDPHVWPAVQLVVVIVFS
jgi:hypothetical protein